MSCEAEHAKTADNSRGSTEEDAPALLKSTASTTSLGHLESTGTGVVSQRSR